MNLWRAPVSTCAADADLAFRVVERGQPFLVGNLEIGAVRHQHLDEFVVARASREVEGRGTLVVGRIDRRTGGNHQAGHPRKVALGRITIDLRLLRFLGDIRTDATLGAIAARDSGKQGRGRSREERIIRAAGRRRRRRRLVRIRAKLQEQSHRFHVARAHRPQQGQAAHYALEAVALHVQHFGVVLVRVGALFQQQARDVESSTRILRWRKQWPRRIQERFPDAEVMRVDCLIERPALRVCPSRQEQRSEIEIAVDDRDHQRPNPVWVLVVQGPFRPRLQQQLGHRHVAVTSGQHQRRLLVRAVPVVGDGTVGQQQPDRFHAVGHRRCKQRRFAKLHGSIDLRSGLQETSDDRRITTSTGLIQRRDAVQVGRIWISASLGQKGDRLFMASEGGPEEGVEPSGSRLFTSTRCAMRRCTAAVSTRRTASGSDWVSWAPPIACRHAASASGAIQRHDCGQPILRAILLGGAMTVIGGGSRGGRSHFPTVCFNAKRRGAASGAHGRQGCREPW